MNWLENNPVGVALVSACGLLLLLALMLAWAWSWPVSSGSGEVDAADQVAQTVPKLDSDLGPLRNYRVVNNRPVFDETRRPQVRIEGEDEGEVITEQAPVEPPDVRLTGVVITPEARIVMLTPNQQGEPVIIRQGMQLEGEYVGWSVRRVGKRKVTLESVEGDSLQIELAVHDAMIAEPPELTPASPTEEGEEEAEDGEPLSRAEEIRRRIQERREQLRREAEQEEEEQAAEKATQRNQYQDAIRAMMNRNRNNENEAKEQEG